VEATRGVKAVVLDRVDRKSDWLTLPTVMYYDLFVNGERIAELRAMPFALEELAIGYLMANAYIEDPQIIEDIVVSADRIDVHADAEFDFRYQYFKEKGIKPIDEAKIEKITSNYTVSRSKIWEKLALAEERAVLSRELPGVNFAFISDYNGQFFLGEDVYQDTALYKAIGRAVKEQFDFRRSMAVVSDVLVPEYVVYTAWLGIPIAGSLRGVPSLSVDVAQHMSGQTLFFEDGRRIYVLSHPQRII